MTADAPAMSLTRQFTDLLSAWPADDPALLDRCRLLLLDGLAVAVAGAAAERGPGLMAAQARSESPDGPSTVIGQGFTTSVANAARVNGMAMHVLDFEPMWNPPNHALSPLLPALLALAEQREREGSGPQGRAVLRAIAKGVEAQGRLRLASGQIEPAKLSMHPPGAVGPLATALACGDLLGLQGERLAAAVGIASSRSGGLLANVGSMTKALHCGDAAANGVQAAQLAAEGFTADADALGSPRGWGAALFGPTFEQEHLVAPIGQGRALNPGPAWKLFPSQFATHFAITAALAARDGMGDRAPNRITRVTLHTPAMPYIDRPQPQSGLDGKFSWQYTAAIALLDGKVVPDSFEDSRRFAADAVALLNRTVLVNDPTISGRFDQMHVEIEIELDDGTMIRRRCDAPLGSWSRPVPAERVMEKIRALFGGVLGSPKTAAIERAIVTADDFPVRPLMAMLA
ncbi:MAG: MmgE/PrpD family protein [Rhizobiales bacterium]|nr:MmgE/PrpD family protein [Hyphomicrobiales bacterium]